MLSERRKYIRISSVLPVEFFIKKEEERVTPWLQGFTNNISYGGICIVVNDLWWGFADRIRKNNKLDLIIHLPLGKKIKAEANLVWKDTKQTEDFRRFYLGVQFTKINNHDKRFLFFYAISKRAIPYLVGGLIILFLGISFFLNQERKELINRNKRLVKNYQESIKIIERLKRGIKQEEKSFKFFKERKEELERRLKILKEKLEEEEEKYKRLLSEKEKKSIKLIEELKEKIDKLKRKIALLNKENLFLKEEIKKRKNLVKGLSRTIKKAEERRKGNFPELIKGMYKWIISRQDLKSGLILSYEGDRELKNVAFSYDEALATIVLTLYGDYKRAERILDFYLKKIEKEPIYNAYYTDGTVFEYITHSGVCAWIGIASLNYYQFTHNKKYLPLAYYVANFLKKMMDEEGGIKGGPQVSWYSTEHNLDAYAFFKLFYKVTKNKEYLKLAEKIKLWLDKYAYTHKNIPVKRGKGDATVATDTFAWSITAIGPQELFSLEMSPDLILDFAEKNCKVKVNFIYKGKNFEIEGFDFSRASNLARGGVISCEWTSQMILAFLIMRDYYKDRDREKSEYYLNKAIFYFEELGKMIISSPSYIGKGFPVLPYASHNFVDTGHGWRTPKGKEVGSLAATTYFLFAYLGYNPLKAEFLNISLKKIYEESKKL